MFLTLPSLVSLEICQEVSKFARSALRSMNQEVLEVLF